MEARYISSMGEFKHDIVLKGGCLIWCSNHLPEN